MCRVVRISSLTSYSWFTTGIKHPKSLLPSLTVTIQFDETVSLVLYGVLTEGLTSYIRYTKLMFFWSYLLYKSLVCYITCIPMVTSNLNDPVTWTQDGELFIIEVFYPTTMFRVRFNHRENKIRPVNLLVGWGNLRSSLNQCKLLCDFGTWVSRQKGYTEEGYPTLPFFIHSSYKNWFGTFIWQVHNGHS